MFSLILMTIFLPIILAGWLYIFNRNKVVCLWFAISGSSAAIQLFFFLKYSFGYAWWIWIISYVALLFYLGRKYPEKMKKLDQGLGGFKK